MLFGIFYFVEIQYRIYHRYEGRLVIENNQRKSAIVFFLRKSAESFIIQIRANLVGLLCKSVEEPIYLSDRFIDNGIDFYFFFVFIIG